MTLAFPKPKDKRNPIPPVKRIDDPTLPWGYREECATTKAGCREYRRRTMAMGKRQGMVCSICKNESRLMTEYDITFEHSGIEGEKQGGRGIGGGRRNDMIELPDGRPINSAAHRWCNAEKGSRR